MCVRVLLCLICRCRRISNTNALSKGMRLSMFLCRIRTLVIPGKLSCAQDSCLWLCAFTKSDSCINASTCARIHVLIYTYALIYKYMQQRMTYAPICPHTRGPRMSSNIHNESALTKGSRISSYLCNGSVRTKGSRMSSRPPNQDCKAALCQFSGNGNKWFAPNSQTVKRWEHVPSVAWVLCTTIITTIIHDFGAGPIASTAQRKLRVLCIYRAETVVNGSRALCENGCERCAAFAKKTVSSTMQTVWCGMTVRPGAMLSEDV